MINTINKILFEAVSINRDKLFNFKENSSFNEETWHQLKSCPSVSSFAALELEQENTRTQQNLYRTDTACNCSSNVFIIDSSKKNYVAESTRLKTNVMFDQNIEPTREK